MKNNREFDLLTDLARLMKKYGPTTFETLAERMTDPSFTKVFADVLNTTAKTHRTLAKTAKSKSRSKSANGAFLSSVNRSDAEKYALLRDLYDDLKNKTVLPTLREMKSFAADNGLPPIKSKSREQALMPFVRTFLKMPLEEVREHLRRISPARTAGDRTLEGWSQIIFGNDVGGHTR
jgi:hypothetical protein